ncbi:MAG TPA: large conductance mechanosensitive channel protein MscL [Candidatus Thermoplasmatota archaeon]
MVPKKPKIADEFRDFIQRGNVLDLAVAVIIGIAFGAVVTSLVNNVIMPPIGVALGGADFSNLFVVLRDGTPPGPYASMAEATAAGASVLGYGAFINALVNFLIIAFVVFMIVRAVGKMKRKQEEEEKKEPTEKDCPKCLMKIPIAATKCGHCTADLGG